MEESCTRKYWLMKAEPDSRIVKGKDFSVDDFESVGFTPWEGVRNYEARNLMKEMDIGDKVSRYPMYSLFCEVSKEAYPDCTPKSDKDNPRWFMVDAKFVSRAQHFVPLSLLRHLASLPSAKPPGAISYLGEDGIDAIKAMPLITRGRLSVQRVSAKCWDVIQTMADKGGWDNMPFEKKKPTKTRHPVDETRPTTSHQTSRYSARQCDEDGGAIRDATKQPKEQVPRQANIKRGRKRKVSTFVSPEDEQDLAPRHKSLRSKSALGLLASGQEQFSISGNETCPFSHLSPQEQYLRHAAGLSMSFLALVVKPLAYISLPVLLFRSVANTSPVGRYYWRVTIFLGSLAVVSTWGIVVAIGMTLVGRRHDVNYVVARIFYNLVSHALGLEVEVEGEEYLQTRPAVMVGNHQSMLDILYLARMFPPKASIMAKRELQWTPLGPWMYMSGAIFIDRGNSTKAHISLEAAGDEMKREGVSLMMYPEGTRHNEEVPTLLPFKKGAFHLAVQAGLPVIPVVCENYWRLYHKGVFGTGVIKVRVLPPTQTTGLTVADVADLATRTREQMLTTLRDISVKVESEEDHKPRDLPESTPEPPSTEVSSDPAVTDDVVPGIPATPSEDTPSETSELSRSIRSLRPDGSVSEYGETDDEGMVHVSRPTH
ncbi:hypothetical protein J3R83DRAFT_742 [Lanmaoa asiatica]|nr:hypothetical protein J3R83DRAFT_742 [Lanmaoa asiatica]